MFAWIMRRREAAERAEKDLIALLAEHGVDAYGEARRREWEAPGDEEATRWRRAAVAIAKRTGKRIGLDTATRMAADADMTATPDVATASRRGPHFSEIDPLDELAAKIARGERRER